MITKHTFLQLFFEQLNKKRIFYFVYGSYFSLPIDTGGSDIDIVVEEGKIDQTEKILLEIAKSGNVSLASKYNNTTTRFYRFLTEFWGVQIDVSYKGFCYRGVSYFPTDRLCQDIIVHNGIVQVLEEHRGFYVDYFKEVIHNGKVKAKYANALVNHIKKHETFCLAEISQLFGKKCSLLVADHLTIEGATSIARPLQRMIHMRMYKRHFVKIILDRIYSLKRLFSPSPGYVIVVEGTDGSGKSTIINHITPILNECFHNFVVYNHLRPKLIPDLGSILGKKEKKEDNIVHCNPHEQPQSGLLVSLFRWGYYMIDYTIGYMVKVWPQIHSKSKVFIFDRYYYDYYWDQKRSRTKLPMWIIKFGEMILPTPDLILCLGGDPSKIYERKPETSLAEVQRQSIMIKQFCLNHNNAMWVDTTIGIEESCKASMSFCYKMLSKRFK